VYVGEVNLLLQACIAALGMLWKMLWALILGFALSGIAQTFVSKEKMASLLGKPGMKEIARASFFGAASSSCSYAATSMARTLFEKGAHIIPAFAFMFASTNLVLELSVVLWVMMGWKFVLAEFVGGLILILVMAALMKLFGPLDAFAAKQIELSKTREEEFEGSEKNWFIVGQAFVSEVKMIWKDVFIGVTVSGFLMVFVPDTFWQSLFLKNGTGFWHLLENALIGPLVSMFSFVCSVGNIPLAATLYHGGISFGGTISFIYADLIIIPLILIYRKYYGTKLAFWITGIFYISMVIAGITVETLFSVLGLLPEPAHSQMMMESFKVDYTFWLNLVFVVIAGVLFWLAKRAPVSEESHCCH
jgi:uncharacterized membrane protein YraQ (UPF0718 family)